MTVNEIELEMIFDSVDEKIQYKVVEKATYRMEGDVRIPLDKKLNNKWRAQKLGSTEPPLYFCFPQSWDNEKIFHFRNEIQT